MIESFECAMASAREVMADCDIPLLDRLQKAHDHDMEQLRRLRFREGYEAGQRSMDAAHYLLKLRLQGLRFGDGSHENLSRLAYAIYPCPTGWGKESCEGVRDKLIELLGGVHDEPEPIPASRCACDADCAGCDGEPQTVAMYDELDNERHKVVCELRKFEPMIGSKPTEEASKLIRCITGKSDSHVACGNDLEETRDRLIHLLDGDEPLPNFSEPNLPKSAENAKPESDDGGENCRITDELRAYSRESVKRDDYMGGLTFDLDRIADRIDEQFTRICWQQEAVLQHTIDTMVDERDKLVDNRDMWRGKAMQLTDVVDRYVGRCEDLLDLLRDAAVDFKNASYGWDYALIVGENITIETERNRLLKERDELRKSLREIAERAGVPHDIDLDEYSDDLVAKATLGKIDSTHEYIGALEWQRDRQRKLLDKYENADTPEEIVRDIHLGIATDSQAVERIRALNG